MKLFLLSFFLVMISSEAKHFIPSSDTLTSKVTSARCFDSGNETIYDYSFEEIFGMRNISFNEYRNKTLLIVNVATYCAATKHYLQLSALKEQYATKNFEIIAFPCNNFGLQEPGVNATEILNGIKYVRPGGGYEPNFVMAKKIDVNGDKQHPIYWFLKRSCASPKDSFAGKERLFYEPKHGRDIRWNFEKFLIHPSSGKAVKRYEFSFEPKDIAADVEKLVNGLELWPSYSGHQHV